MASNVRIGLVGDYNPAVTAHAAIPTALALAGRECGCQVEPAWVATASLNQDVRKHLGKFHGLWCVPASPYASTKGALEAIRFARETGLPFLGTCGGYQHAILEYARNVLGFCDAASAETDPDASMLLIAPLSCALVEKDGDIVLLHGTHIREIYGVERVEERYHCSYGFNPRYVSLFEATEMAISAVDLEGDPRAVELTTHAFFVGTAFQPERSALNGQSHPLVVEFVRAAGRNEGEW